MTGTARRTPAARGHLAQLVVVLAVLAGLGFVIGLQCTDGMTTGMTMAHGATPAAAVMACYSVPAPSSAASAGIRPCAAPALTFADAADDPSGPGGLGGMLATCLMFLIAVVTVVATLRPGRPGSMGRTPRPAHVPFLRAVRPRAPRLTELCVLRT